MSESVGNLWAVIDTLCYFQEKEDFLFWPKITQDVYNAQNISLNIALLKDWLSAYKYAVKNCVYVTFIIYGPFVKNTFRIFIKSPPYKNAIFKFASWAWFI